MESEKKARKRRGTAEERKGKKEKVESIYSHTEEYNMDRCL